MEIYKNSIITPDGTELISIDVHDFNSYIDKNGKSYSVDGGNEYLRRVGNFDYIDSSVTSDSTHKEIRESFKWGTYGKSGKEKYRKVKLKDMDIDHIEAILETQKQISEETRNSFQNELNFRI